MFIDTSLLRLLRLLRFLPTRTFHFFILTIPYTEKRDNTSSSMVFKGKELFRLPFSEQVNCRNRNVPLFAKKIFSLKRYTADFHQMCRSKRASISFLNLCGSEFTQHAHCDQIFLTEPFAGVFWLGPVLS